MYRVFFFFFQAEDGIRDLYVTGVQTCALPISAAGRRSPMPRRRRSRSAGNARRLPRAAARPAGWRATPPARRRPATDARALLLASDSRHSTLHAPSVRTLMTTVLRRAAGHVAQPYLDERGMQAHRQGGELAHRFFRACLRLGSPLVVNRA